MGNLCCTLHAKVQANPLVRRETAVGNTIIRVIRGNLAEETADVIGKLKAVNPANSQLKHIGGVSSTLVHSGGLVIQHMSNLYVQKFGCVPEGHVVETTSGDLSCDFLLHAVVRPYFDGLTGELESLTSAIREALGIAVLKKAASIAIPAVGSGVFGYPRDSVAQAILGEVEEHLKGTTTLLEVRLTSSDEVALRCFETEFDRRFCI
jgi:O-acetyl-ADP-ribose deacetylase (regulator of RNase III)